VRRKVLQWDTTIPIRPFKEGALADMGSTIELEGVTDASFADTESARTLEIGGRSKRGPLKEDGPGALLDDDGLTGRFDRTSKALHEVIPESGDADRASKNEMIDETTAIAPPAASPISPVGQLVIKLPANGQPTWPRWMRGTLVGGGHTPSHSSLMQTIRRSLVRIASSNAPVVILGESGVGKEVLALEVHSLSARAAKPFLKLNCAALPSELLESEMFGYERGAFTGAYRPKPGLFELADGGTLLLDEMGDMDLRLQAKLLHVLQDGGFQRLGGRATVRVDVRVIAATHCDLHRAIQERRFREDLYYRLNVIQICIPPLRERTDEIPGLVDLFLKKYQAGGVECPRVSPELMQLFLEYSWPGNIRELENAIHRLSVLQDTDTLVREFRTALQRSSDQSAGVRTRAADPPAESLWQCEPVSCSVFEQAERMKLAQEGEAIYEALTATQWNRKKAAQLLGVEYKALLYKMKKLGIVPASGPTGTAARLMSPGRASSRGASRFCGGVATGAL
jgi:DNA-binding NtrC family response regulator